MTDHQRSQKHRMLSKPINTVCLTISINAWIECQKAYFKSDSLQRSTIKRGSRHIVTSSESINDEVQKIVKRGLIFYCSVKQKAFENEKTFAIIRIIRRSQSMFLDCDHCFHRNENYEPSSSTRCLNGCQQLPTT